jgi:hypothetical protein
MSKRKEKKRKENFMKHILLANTRKQWISEYGLDMNISCQSDINLELLFQFIFIYSILFYAVYFS